MNFIRFSDLCANGRAAGQRVFIRADLNVPQDDSGRITEDTRIRASVPCLQMALDAGAAVRRAGMLALESTAILAATRYAPAALARHGARLRSMHAALGRFGPAQAG